MRRLLRSSILILFHTIVVRPVLAALGVRYRRRNLVPRGPCLIVANHNSHLDAPVLMSLFPLLRLPKVHPVAAADYFGETWLRRTMAMLMMNAIPIERKPSPGMDALAPIAEALAAGESLIFFPEGSRGEAGVVAKFRPGIGRLVRSVPGLLVVPVFVSGPERIWARGQRVPVPNSVDLSVGKPRTYPAEAEPQEIAEQVRRDVLALAPPPPPLPGPRPTPPTSVAICSVDPELRRQVFREVTEELGRLAPSIGVSDPVLEAGPGGVRELAGGIAVARSRAWVGLLARVLRTGGWYKGSKFASMVERARIDEALQYGHGSRFVVGDGNALVDLLAWTEAEGRRGLGEERDLQRLIQYLTGQRRIPAAHWWRFIRRAPEMWLINTLDLARPPAPSVLVLVKESPARAMARLRTRGEELDPHDNEGFLAELQSSYENVATALKRRWRVEVLEFDADTVRPEHVAARAVDRVRELVTEPDTGVRS